MLKKEQIEKLSPMMKHYLTLKEGYKDAIILYRLGDFYEMFFEDAKIASKILELTLTGRECGLEERAPMCGVPYHSIERYIARLIDNGYKVAICEQLTTPAQSKGMVKRDVVRVITPGTVTETSMLNETKSNYIASVHIDEKVTGVSWADITTGEFYAYEFNNDTDVLENLLCTISPREIISSDHAFIISSDFNSIKQKDIPKFETYYSWAFDYHTAVKTLCKQFNVLSLESYEIESKKVSLSAAGALIEYINDTQKRKLDNINSIEYINSNTYMYLDSQTRRNLEINQTIKDSKKRGSLLWLLDRTSTNMGARLLNKWLSQPLIDDKQINARLNAVDELIKIEEVDDLQNNLNTIRDLERLAGKIAYGTISPRECLAIKDSLAKLPYAKNSLDSYKAPLLTSIKSKIDTMENVFDLLDKSINENCPNLMKDGGYIKEGFSDELDELRDIKINGCDWLARIEAKEKEETGIKNLKIGFNKVFGYFIEIPKSNTDKAPYRYVRKQTLTNCERYITEELKEIEDKILKADTKAIDLESKLFNEIKDVLKSNISNLQQNAYAIAQFDVLLSFANLSISNRYIKPTIHSKVKEINIFEGRHPVVEALAKTCDYVSNDTVLDNKDNNTMIITGPNMAGKSTYMRQVALITLMAHMGCFVPASKAKISITDRIFTRVGASDDVTSGQSTFMVEMIETATILNNATDKSLLILDEIGRGTSTYDGLSIAWSVMEYINSSIKAKTMFATHYHELTELEGTLKGVKNYRILVNEQQTGIVFLHKIARGGTNKSFGIEVAQLAGVPQEVIIRAKSIAKALEQSDINNDSNSIKLNALGLENSSLKQMSFIQDEKKEENEIMGILKDTNIDNMTPMQAFVMLNEMIKKVKDA